MKIKITASTPKVGSEHSKTVKVDDSEWNELSEQERDEYMQEQLWDIVTWRYDEVKDNE